MSGKRAPKDVLTDKALKAFPNAPAGKRYVVHDLSQPHFGVRITDKGVKSFIVTKRIKGTKAPITHTLGTYPEMKLAKARELAKEALEVIAGGVAPRVQKQREIEAAREQDVSTFEAVAKDFVQKHLAKNRTRAESERIINTYLLPRFGSHQIADIRRRDIADLLDDLEQGKFKNPDSSARGGPVMADRTLACLRKMTNWYAARNEDYVSPITREIARTKPKERARDRILSNHEIMALWAALDEARVVTKEWSLGDVIYAALVRVLLFTAQRRDDVAAMCRSEISADGDWMIPAERYKTKKAQLVPLSQAVRKYLDDVPVVGDRCFIFSTDGKNAFSGFSKAKAALDLRMLQHMRRQAEMRQDEQVMAFVDTITQLKLKAEQGDKSAREKLKTIWWRHHDLRRTAKTLMIGSGVRPDISERVLGHEINGVEGVYDRWDYRAEKREALEKLAMTVQKIVG